MCTRGCGRRRLPLRRALPAHAVASSGPDQPDRGPSGGGRWPPTDGHGCCDRDGAGTPCMETVSSERSPPCGRCDRNDAARWRRERRCCDCVPWGGPAERLGPQSRLRLSRPASASVGRVRHPAGRGLCGAGNARRGRCSGRLAGVRGVWPWPRPIKHTNDTGPPWAEPPPSPSAGHSYVARGRRRGQCAVFPQRDCRRDTPATPARGRRARAAAGPASG